MALQPFGAAGCWPRQGLFGEGGLDRAQLIVLAGVHFRALMWTQALASTCSQTRFISTSLPVTATFRSL